MTMKIKESFKVRKAFLWIYFFFQKTFIIFILLTSHPTNVQEFHQKIHFFIHYCIEFSYLA